jgi:hypothetical protein
MKSVTAHLLNGGVLWGLKGKDGLFSDIHVSVQLGNEQASHWPFLRPNLHTSFRPDRVAIETADSQVVQEPSIPANLSRDTFLKRLGMICNLRISLVTPCGC